MNGIATGLAWLAGLGLAQVLLWVLTFAVVFAVLTKVKIFGRAPAALISIVAGIFVLLAVPGAVIQVIAGMSTGLVAIAIGILVLVALLEVAGAEWIMQTDEGPKRTGANWIKGHGTAVAAVVLVLTAIVFYVSGGASLIGIGIPTFGWATWFLVLVGIAVLWMLSEA